MIKSYGVFVSQVIYEAERWVIRSVRKGQYYQVILCTCSAAGSHRVLAEVERVNRESARVTTGNETVTKNTEIVEGACNNTIQCIVDEAGMCLEPETLIPIARSKAKQVVLIGDHKQLQPIVTNKAAMSLGLQISLFERYSHMAMMLEEQYRMVMYISCKLKKGTWA